MTERQHDVVIVGGGPAGVSAALECKDINLDVVLVDARTALGGQLTEISHPVRNVATGLYADGPALQAGLERVAELLGDRVRLEHVVSAAGLAEGWIEAGARRFHGKAVLIATGSTPELLPIAISGSFGGDVTYHVESDPDRFTGRPVVVVGGGDSATLDALFLAQTSSSVILAHRSAGLTARHDIIAQLRADERIEDLPGWEVESLSGGERLESVDLVRPATGERRTVPAGGLVVKISRDPCTQVFRGQLDLDRRGFIVADRELRTSCPGVFAAGDVVSGAYWRVSNALGHGSLVSRTILRYLQDGVGTDPGTRPLSPKRPAQ
ncbi:MAG TPA: NAD(P)/FAD-dependent oxidoreductase [Acidimicrobiales bacterium]|nr:NAD(P)/FAD-dependent oxidoreductase [Acidimicrobiales bacterium]